MPAWTPRHKQRRGRFGIWEANLALGENGTTPINAPLTIKPGSDPSGTQQEGDIWWNDTNNAPSFYDGTNKQQFAGLGAAQTWTGVQTYSAAQVFSTAPTGASVRRVVKTAVATLTAADNGALCVFNSAAGDIYTLPVPVSGLWFDFVVTVTATSNNQKIITDSASTFLLGTFVQSTDGTYTSALQAANGTTIRAWTGNGTTTGGIKGDWFRIVAISATQWVIAGMGSATGSEATPFATS